MVVVVMVMVVPVEPGYSHRPHPGVLVRMVVRLDLLVMVEVEVVELLHQDRWGVL